MVVGFQLENNIVEKKWVSINGKPLRNMNNEIITIL
jgi:hypothetical protein